MKKRDSGEVYRFRWQVQRELCSIPSCSAVSNMQKHPFTWRDICNTIGIGCSCKKGCATRGCSCLKAEQKCGPGCSCCNCENTFNALIHVALKVEIETAGIKTDEVEADEAQRQQYFNEIVEDEEKDSENSSSDVKT